MESSFNFEKLLLETNSPKDESDTQSLLGSSLTRNGALVFFKSNELIDHAQKVLEKSHVKQNAEDGKENKQLRRLRKKLHQAILLFDDASIKMLDNLKDKQLHNDIIAYSRDLILTLAEMQLCLKQFEQCRQNKDNYNNNILVSKNIAVTMAASRRLPAMDIHHINEEHEVQYRLSKDRYPTEESNDEFELFTCPYDSLHKINSKTWRSHLIKCAKNYGGNIKICTFNASHRVPEPELEWHNMTCSDRHIIASHYETRDWRMATQVNHQPDWIEPEGESWDDEADSTAPTFRLNYDKAMPIQLLQHQPECEEESNNYVEDSEEESEEASEKDVLSEILIPEKPENWNDMSKSQKKNYKRKYDRQQQRMKEQGVTNEDFLRKPHVSLLTDSQINNRLNAIKALFPMNNHKEHAERVDYTSLLNIVCQKIRLNQPVYELTSAPHGGFMFKCRVHLDWYYGRDFCANKKDAKHNAAKWALLSMTIPGIDTEPPAPRAKPIPPSLRNNKDLREGDEVAKLSVAGMYPNQQVMPLRPPNKLPSNNITKLETPKEPVSVNMSNQTSSSSNGQAWGQQTSVKMPKSSASQPMKQPEVNSNPARQSASQQPARPPATQSAWGQHANKNGHSSGPQGAWGQPANTTRQLQAGQPRSGQPNLLNGLQNLNLKDAGDFPALGGTAKNTSNPKKGMARGRGRGTVMKL